jgi:hypothetical protein
MEQKAKFKIKVPTLDLQRVIEYCKNNLTQATAETIAWVGVLLIHAATIPTMIALMTGLSDKTPPIELVLFIWGGLALFFVRAAILKDMLNVITIGFGFLVHAVMLSLVMFK